MIVEICVTTDANAAPEAPNNGIRKYFITTFVIADPIYRYFRYFDSHNL